jgi:predicted ester cyclase
VTSIVPDHATDTVERNQELVRQHLDVLNAGDPKAAAGLYCAEDMTNFGRPVGRAGFLRVLEDIFGTFPDWHWEVTEIVAAGDSVVVRCTASGTHRGIGRAAVNGGMLVNVEPTGKRFEVQHIHWYKLRGGKIVDHFATRDDLGMMRQLGLLPSIQPSNSK